MTALDMATTQAKLVEIAQLSLEVVDLDKFIEESAGAAPDACSAELRELAVAVAELQRVAHRQLAQPGAT